MLFVWCGPWVVVPFRERLFEGCLDCGIVRGRGNRWLRETKGFGCLPEVTVDGLPRHPAGRRDWDVWVHGTRLPFSLSKGSRIRKTKAREGGGGEQSIGSRVPRRGRLRISRKTALPVTEEEGGIVGGVCCVERAVVCDCRRSKNRGAHVHSCRQKQAVDPLPPATCKDWSSEQELVPTTNIGRAHTPLNAAH